MEICEEVFDERNSSLPVGKIPLKKAIRLNMDLGRYIYEPLEDGSSMAGFHVNVHRNFLEKMYLTAFGGNESLQKPKSDKKIFCLVTTKPYSTNILAPVEREDGLN